MRILSDSVTKNYQQVFKTNRKYKNDNWISFKFTEIYFEIYRKITKIIGDSRQNNTQVKQNCLDIPQKNIDVPRKNIDNL